MADYVAQTDAQLDPDAPLTSELAYGWRDNLIAVTEGAAGAPRIVAGALSIATNSVSGGLAGGGLLRINLDRKSFFPDIRSLAGNISMAVAIGEPAASPTTPGFALFNSAGGNRNYSVAWEYIAT